jgi:S-methylmethionine-dependent homocysteine/selenocysteine methylase
VALTRETGLGFVLESPTWRASPRWADEIGYDAGQLDEMNRKAIALLEEIREREVDGSAPIVISGCVGPQDDGYNPAELLSAEAAKSYHSTQIGTFADTAADMVTAITITYVEEAVGIVRAAGEHGMPVAISFTVETDGRLPSGQALGEAIEQVDSETDPAPAYFMVNCAHPTHFEGVVAGDGGWRRRIRGLRANASTKSHAELDEATELDDGDPADLAARYAGLRRALPELNVLGGCCGTDHRHVAAIRDAWL